MNTKEIESAKKLIQTDYQDKQEVLTNELDRYVNTNNTRNSNKLTFVNLSPELRYIIAKTKSTATGKIYSKPNGR